MNIHIRSYFSRIAITLVISIFFSSIPLVASDPVSERSSAGMVSTACSEATSVGVAILEKGGNAIDAAVATGFALAVTFPSAGNIGGGGFLLARMDSGTVFFIDFREKAPMAASENMYLDRAGDVIKGMSTTGHRACGVPGTVAGLYMAWEKYGTLEWEELIEPSIRLAEKGFTIDYHLARSLRKLMKYDSEYPGVKKFYRESGRPMVPEDTLVQPELARVLKLIAQDGPEAFYQGWVARLIVREMERGGGLIKMDDLNEYRAVFREPVIGSYRGHIVISAPPPSSGGIVLLEILNILEGFDMQENDRVKADVEHLLIEAERRAYRDRAQFLGDPDFIDMPLGRLLSREYADRLRNSIGESATPSSSLGKALPGSHESEETTHYSIADGEGNVVAVTTTLNSAYGSKVVVEGAGFLMNNEMDDFSSKPGVPNIYGLVGGKANSIEPGKRMLSSMTPTIVLRDEKPLLVLGSPGGSTIITTVTRIIVNIIDLCMSPQEAVSDGRIHHQWMPDKVYYEKGMVDRSVIEGLKSRGHIIKERAPIGDAQVIMIQEKEMYGVSDPRRGGSSRGVRKVVRKGVD
ncbi:MAG: gamma-glutamyltransferase [Bacteroidales bacterium]|nr:gamma-glutamyltransferase [Candidatus Latescibacterota bacterium]